MACIEFIKSRISNGDGEIDAMLFWLKVIRQRSIDEEKRTDRMELILCRKLLTLKRITEAGMTLVLKIKKNGHTIKCLSTSLKNLQDAIRIFAIRRNLTALLPEPVYVKGRLIPALDKRLGRLLQSSRLKMESARMRREKEVKDRVDLNRLVKVARGEVSVKKPSPMERASYTHRDMKARFECRHGSRIRVKALVWRSTLDTFPENDMIVEEEHTAVEEVSEPSINQDPAVVALQTTNKCLTEEESTEAGEVSEPSINQEPAVVALQTTNKCLTEEESTEAGEVSEPSINQEPTVEALQRTNECLTEEELTAVEGEVSEPSINQEPTVEALQPTNECLTEEESTEAGEVSEPSIKQEQAVVQLHTTDECRTEEEPTAVEGEVFEPSINQEPAELALQITNECLTEEEATAHGKISEPSVKQEPAVVPLHTTDECRTEKEPTAEEEDTFLTTYINQTIHQASLNHSSHEGEDMVSPRLRPLEPLTQTTPPKARRKSKKKKKSGKVSPLTLAPLSPRGLGGSVLPPICPSPGSSPLSSPRSTSAEVNSDKSDGAETKSITSKNHETEADAIWPRSSGGSTSVMDIYGANDLGKESSSSSPSIVKEKKQNAIMRTWKRFRALFRRKNKVAPQ